MADLRKLDGAIAALRSDRVVRRIGHEVQVTYNNETGIIVQVNGRIVQEIKGATSYQEAWRVGEAKLKTLSAVGIIASLNVHEI
jgi:thioredoxin reductase